MGAEASKPGDRQTNSRDLPLPVRPRTSTSSGSKRSGLQEAFDCSSCASGCGRSDQKGTAASTVLRGVHSINRPRTPLTPATKEREEPFVISSDKAIFAGREERALQTQIENVEWSRLDAADKAIVQQYSSPLFAAELPKFLAEIKAYREELEQLEKELTKHTRNGNREKIAELCEERDRRLAFIDKQRGMMTVRIVEINKLRMLEEDLR